MLLFQSLKISLGAFCYIYGYGQKQIYRADLQRLRRYYRLAQLYIIHSPKSFILSSLAPPSLYQLSSD